MLKLYKINKNFNYSSVLEAPKMPSHHFWVYKGMTENERANFPLDHTKKVKILKKRSSLLKYCYSISGLFRSLCLSVCWFVYCGQMVQDRPIVWIEVEQECGDDISISPIFDPLCRGFDLGGGAQFEMGFPAKRRQIEQNVALRGIGKSSHSLWIFRVVTGFFSCLRAAWNACWYVGVNQIVP